MSGLTDWLKRFLRPVSYAGGFPFPDSQTGESLEVRLLQSGAARYSRKDERTGRC